MQKKIISLAAMGALVSLAFALPVFAGPTDVEGNCYFFANGTVKVVDLDTDEEVYDYAVSGADDVVVDGTKVVVSSIDTNGGRSVAVFDVPAECIAASENSGECNQDMFLARYNVNSNGSGYMEIPGVDVDGTIYTVTMEQRGNSNNWEVNYDTLEEIEEDDDSSND